MKEIGGIDLFYEKKTHIFVVCVLALLLTGFLFPTESGRIAGAVLTALAAVVGSLIIQKRPALSIHSRMVLLIMGMMGLLFMMLYYMSGLIFGYYYALVRFSLSTFLLYILPISVTIVASEIVRSIMLAQNSRLVSFLSYLICLVAEVLVTAGLRSVHTSNALVDALGYYVFPAVTANILYHYIGGLYGKYPSIVYRLITTLALYIVPVTSKLSNAIYAFARLAVPLLIYVFIKALYGKRKNTAQVRKRRVMLWVSTAVMAVLMLSFILLVSGQAKYGLMVIATESMSGEINKGDAVLYVAYDDQTIKEGQVIIFEKNKRYVVHRVVNIVIVDGAARYYTKGDANEDLDAGYITDADIVGLTDFKIPYIGMPTLWLHDLIS